MWTLHGLMQGMLLETRSFVGHALIISGIKFVTFSSRFCTYSVGLHTGISCELMGILK